MIVQGPLSPNASYLPACQGPSAGQTFSFHGMISKASNPHNATLWLSVTLHDPTNLLNIAELLIITKMDV